LLEVSQSPGYSLRLNEAARFSEIDELQLLSHTLSASKVGRSPRSRIRHTSMSVTFVTFLFLNNRSLREL